ncbi:MAG: nitrate/sulfonate/bicarbonate ABC transporter ATP-binding protein [Opitutales bacterium]|jgi:NitT/TauT family transport system ATP-binding protein
MNAAPSTQESPSASQPSSPPVIAELRKASKAFVLAGGHPYTVLDRIDLSVREGELFALLGQSGSGKSTILRCLTGLVRPTSGEVLSYGQPLGGINPHASIVFQTFALYPWLTVEQNVAVGLTSKRLSTSQKCTAIENALELIGLLNFRSAYPRELSGGMRQRVGMARAIVSSPKLLCLDEAFSALDVLTAENLRQEVIALWRSANNPLKSIFMVTHNIEEAVEMATRICVLFPRPGRLGLVLENNLPYPRDYKSPEFQNLVAVIHETITKLVLPDLPPEPAPKPGQPISRAKSRMESIPCVPVGQIIGLVTILKDTPEITSIFDLASEIGKGFGEVIAIVKAAEILDLVETPKNDIRLTPLGEKFCATDRAGRKKILTEQIYKLRLFHIILAYLEINKETEADKIIKDISEALPHDNPEQVFQTMIAWGRYAGIMDYNADTKTVFIPQDDDDTPA